MPRLTKTIKKAKVVSGENYCRMCQKMLSLDKFYEATNPFLDKNGFMSICRVHCNEIYSHYFSIYNNMEKAIRLTCQDLDIRFSVKALEQVQSHIDKLLSTGKKADSVFGYYKSKISSISKNNEGIDSFRYKDSDDIVIQDKLNGIDEDEIINFELSESNFELTESIVKHWGKNRKLWEYEFLEEEIFNLKTDFECPDYGMEMIMKDICFINLEIEKIRQGLEKGEITKLIESRSKLMNDGNLKPVQSTGADKNEKLSLGVFIKKWENEKPVRQEIDDEMNKYIDTYMVGHLAKMEGLANDAVKKYDESIKDYTINLNSINNEEDDE